MKLLKMKTTATILLFVLCFNHSFGQSISQCEEIVLKIYDGINQKKTEDLMRYLSDDFSMAGQKGEIAKMVFSQLISKLNTKVSNIKKISETQTDVLTLVYTSDFSERSSKTSTFIFNKDNQLKELELLAISVMTKKNADVKQGDQNYFSLPFKKYGKLIAVEAKLNGIIKTFIIDNGSPVLVLNNAHLHKDTTKKILSNNTDLKGVGGTITGMGLEKIKSFELKDISMSEQNVTTLDLSHLEKELKKEFDGLIGYEVYKDYDLLFDYQNYILTFIKPEYTETYLLEQYDTNNIKRIPIEMGVHIPIVVGYINNNSYAFGIDCGAESNLIDLSLKDSLKKEVRKFKKTTLDGLDKTKNNVLEGKLKSFKIEDILFENKNFVISDISHLNQSYQLKLDGLIGYEILSNQPTLLSYKNKFITFIIKE